MFGDFLAHEGKDLIAHARQHFIAAELFKVLPAQVLLLGAVESLVVFAEALGAALLAGLIEVEQTQEHQVRDLLDDGDRIADTAGVEVQPEGVDFRFERLH